MNLWILKQLLTFNICYYFLMQRCFFFCLKIRILQCTKSCVNKVCSYQSNKWMSNKSLIYGMDFKLLLNYGLMFICHENIQSSNFSILKSKSHLWCQDLSRKSEGKHSRLIIPFDKWYVVKVRSLCSYSRWAATFIKYLFQKMYRILSICQKIMRQWHTQNSDKKR